jgi:hypothetical protein
MLKRLALFSMFLLVTLCATPRITLAQQKETPVSNREIAERLIRLEEGQKALAQRLEDVNTNLNKRIDDLRGEMNNRFDDLMTFQHIIVSALIALVLAIAGAGFVMWRKILEVDATVQTKLGLDHMVKDRIFLLEQEVGFVKGKLQELSVTVENMAKGRG